MFPTTPEPNLISFGCWLSIFALMLYACVGLYKLWKIHFHHKSTYGWRQSVKLLLWLMLVVVTIFSSSGLLWVFLTVMAEMYL